MPMVMPTVAISNPVFKHPTTTYSTFVVLVNYSGTISFDITADGDSVNPDWKNVNLTSGQVAVGGFDTVGSDVRFRIIGLPGSVINGAIDIRVG